MIDFDYIDALIEMHNEGFIIPDHDNIYIYFDQQYPIIFDVIIQQTYIKYNNEWVIMQFKV